MQTHYLIQDFWVRACEKRIVLSAAEKEKM